MRACSASVRCGLQPMCLQRCMHFTAAVQATHLLNDLDSHLCQEPALRALGKNEAGNRVLQVVSCTAVVGAFTLLVTWQMTWDPLVRLQVYGLYFL